MSHGWDQDESHVGSSSMMSPCNRGLKKKHLENLPSDEFVLGKQQADGSWEHLGSTLRAHRERSMSQRCILATAQED